MRLATVLIATCLCAASAEADPISRDSLDGLEDCFTAARSVSVFCDKLSNHTAARLDCLQDVRDAQQECLDRVHASMEREELLLPPSLRAPSLEATGETPRVPGKR